MNAAASFAMRPLTPNEAQAAALANAARAPIDPSEQMWRMARAEISQIAERIAAIERRLERTANE